MVQIASKDITKLRSAREQIHRLGVQQQREEIGRVSPYSADITSHIHIYKELWLYHSLQLQESYITRPCLVKDIDFDLWISAEKCTNLELMQKGKSPYAFDAPEGRIELHHIGQDYNAPFVELTLEEHNDNSQLLHYSRKESWRSNKALSSAFETERISYWKRRAKRDYTIAEWPSAELADVHYKKQQEYTAELRETCEEIYRQCDAEDLDYLSDLAKSYAMMQRVGASTMSEFISNVREARQTAIQCPSCKASDYILSGAYQAQGEKVQRYKCKACNKVFTLNKQSLVSGSSFSFRDWIKFIDCLYNGYTLEQIARSCDISTRTAHDNRTRLFYALKLLNDKVRLQGNVVIDETYIPVSFKGNHSKQDDFIMPRESYKRGGENHKKGITDNHVCIVCAVDDNGSSIAKVAGTGNTSAVKLKYVLQDHFGEEVFCLYSDKSNAIKRFAEVCNYEIKQGKLLRKGTKKAANVEFNRDTFIINRYLQIINSYHSRLKKFLNRFSGISTKYLSGYLYLFAWKERNKEREPAEAYKELLAVLAEPDNYISVEDILKQGYLPDAIEISENYRKKKYVPTDQDREIYRRYADGETMTSIAASYNMTKQAISLKIRDFRENGHGYKTIKDIEREKTRSVTPQGYIPKSTLRLMIRDYQIYTERQQWTGSPNDFYKAMMDKFGLSKRTVQNSIFTIKRMEQLREELYIHQDIPYRTQEEVYQEVYADYLELKSEKPAKTQTSIFQILSEKHHLTPANANRVVRIMETNDLGSYFASERRLTKTEVYKRDKALFIDYLRWTGDKISFYGWAAQKYHLSADYIREILKYCLRADLKRFDIT